MGRSKSTESTAEGAIEIALLDVQVMAQDGAAVAQVDAQVEQVVFCGTDFLHPERHHLHVAVCARTGNSVFIETTLHFNQAQHQFGFKAGTGSFVMHRTQEIEARLGIGDAFPQAV